MRTAPKLALLIIGLVAIVIVTASFRYSSTSLPETPAKNPFIHSPPIGLSDIEGADQYQAEIDALEKTRLEAAAKAEADAKEAEAKAKAQAARPIVVTRPAVSQNIQDGSTVWDRISTCEAGNDWARNSGNGFYGGLQMDKDFWNSYGDIAQWARADLAPREAQIAAATLARDSGRGYVPWPTCSRILGLR